MIAGNHDSTERVSFAASLLEKSDVHISEVYKGKILPIKAQDEHGVINVWLMPYLKPSIVRSYFRGHEITSYSESVKAALSNLDINTAERNILIAHQFVTGALRCESDEVFVGGSENVDATLFDAFDYVALGHLHRPQNIYRETLRYSGTPLKYSLSEADHVKSVTVVDMGSKGSIEIIEIPLSPLNGLREIRGTYKELTALKNYSKTNTNDYVYIVLTDEDEEPEAIQKLRNIYPNIMRLRYDNARTQAVLPDIIVSSHDNKEPVDLFSELYEMQNGQPMSETQRDYSFNLLEKIWGESV
jgi:exonuclease SbcD